MNIQFAGRRRLRATEYVSSKIRRLLSKKYMLNSDGEHKSSKVLYDLYRALMDS